MPSAERASAWLREAALPLWADRGFDEKAGAFEEQLDFSGAPVTDVPRRLMVQARQVAVYSAAALSGRFPAGRERAITAAHGMVERYLEADGAPGWVFSLGRDGRPLDRRRDLYAHAFVLFGLSWARRLEDDPAFAAAIDRTLEVLDGRFAVPAHGGYRDCLPPADPLRRQNPHMHLFEALLALAETGGHAGALERCRSLHALALARFFEPSSGAIRECFGEDWSVHPSPGAASVEPGHVFEWISLLRSYERLSGEDQSGPVAALLGFALHYGLDRKSGRIPDEVGEDGTCIRASSRLWPHTEALKALSAEARRGRTDLAPLIGPVLSRLAAIYCRPDLAGGWIDHVDADDRPTSRAMPASSLYHVYFALAEVEEFRSVQEARRAASRNCGDKAAAPGDVVAGTGSR